MATRHNIATLSILSVLLAISRVASAQSVSESEVLAAIQAGENKKMEALVSTCVAGPGFGEDFAAGLAGGLQHNGSYSVTVSTNAGRIAYMAASAKRLYKKFTPDNMTDELRTPSVFVNVEPNKPPRGRNEVSVPAPIQHVVLKSKAKPEAVAQPTKLDTEQVAFSNLLGATLDASRAVAIFDLVAVRELPAGDVDVVIVTAAGERRCKIGGKDRARLFTEAR